MNAQLAADTAKAAPPVVVSTLSAFGIPLDQVTYALTALYTVLLITQHVWKNWIKPVMERRSNGRAA